MSVNETTIASTINARTPPTRGIPFDPVLLLILALPWVVLYFDTTWLFAYPTSSFGFIDPWIYFGFFFDLTQHIRTFKGAYFTTRLTWTVPGAVVYHLFSPLVATYVLHLVIFYGSILPLYLILKVTVNRSAALLATTMMAFHSYFLWSVGWPYIDGAGNMYVLLTLACLAFAARAQEPRWWLVAAGAVAAKTMYCQFFLISFAPLILGFYYFARRELGHRRSTAEWKPFAWGFAFVTVLYGVFNMAVNGRFLFFINSVGMAAKIVIHRNPYNDSTYGWIAGATWLVLPALTAVGAIVCVSRRRSLLSIPNAEFLLFWQRYLLLNVVIMIFWQLVGQPVLQLPTYASYLMPAVFLALGSQIAVVTHGLSKIGLALVYAGVFLAGVLPFMPRLDLHPLTAHPMLLPFVHRRNRARSDRKADQIRWSCRDRDPGHRPGRAQRRHQHAHVESRLSAPRRRLPEIRPARHRRQHPHRAIARPQRQSLTSGTTANPASAASIATWRRPTSGPTACKANPSPTRAPKPRLSIAES